MLCTACFRTAGCQCSSSMAAQSSCKESTEEPWGSSEAAPASEILAGIDRQECLCLSPLLLLASCLAHSCSSDCCSSKEEQV